MLSSFDIMALLLYFNSFLLFGKGCPSFWSACRFIWISSLGGMLLDALLPAALLGIQDYWRRLVALCFAELVLKSMTLNILPFK